MAHGGSGAHARPPSGITSCSTGSCAEVAAYNPDVDRDLLERAYHFASASARRPAAPERRGLHPAPARRRADPRASCADPTRRSPPRSSTTSSRTRTRRSRRFASEFGDEVARLVEGVTKLTRIQLPEPRAGPGGELPQDDRGDGAGPRRHPHQARRPPPQHAHDRVPGQAEAAPEGPRDARGLRAARAPPRYPHDQVGARGPRVPDAAPAQVRRDPGDGQPAPRGAREVRRERRRRRSSRSSRRSGSPPTSPRARSTSTPSTRRWPSAGRSSTRSTT